VSSGYGTYETTCPTNALTTRAFHPEFYFCERKTSGRSFEIATAQDVSVTINASKGNGRVTGVALKKHKPAPGVRIVLAPVDLKSNPALFRRDQADSDGTFALNFVVPCRYTLMAIESGWIWSGPIRAFCKNTLLVARVCGSRQTKKRKST